METRGSVIEIDADTGQLTIHSATQSSHMLRWATAALTGKETVRASLKRLASNKERRAAFGAGAKQFVGENSDSLKGQDNDGAKSQFKRDKSLPKHMAGIGLGLIAKDTYPIIKAQDIGGGFGSKGAVRARTSRSPPRRSISGGRSSGSRIAARTCSTVATLVRRISPCRSPSTTTARCAACGSTSCSTRVRTPPSRSPWRCSAA